MANPKDLAMLKQGVEKWNDWRMGRSETVVDLRGADLHGINLIGATFRKANLSGPIFRMPICAKLFSPMPASAGPT
jgi:uncharacterized protein YjbI with pentapeptide repeats